MRSPIQAHIQADHILVIEQIVPALKQYVGFLAAGQALGGLSEFKNQS